MPVLQSDQRDDVGEFEERRRMCRTLRPGIVPFAVTENAIACDLAEIKKQLGDVIEGQTKLESGILQVHEQLSRQATYGEPVVAEAKKAGVGHCEVIKVAHALPQAGPSTAKNEDTPRSKRTHTVLPLQKRFMRDASTCSLLDPSKVACPSSADMSHWMIAASRASRNAFADTRQTANDDMNLLHQIFAMSEDEEQRIQEWRSRKKYPCWYAYTVLASLSFSAWEMAIDTLVGSLVVMNCVFIGLAMDYSDDSTPWLAVDTVFSVVFLLELGLKLSLHGCRAHFGKFNNIFDAGLVFTDVLQLLLVVFLKDEYDVKDAPSASVFRIVRLTKLSRVLRVLRQPAFNDVLAMLQGMIGGMTTLFWAIVLFLTAVYVVALVFRESFGRRQVDVVTQYFDSVPRSMFTTFRCSFGDCTSHSGVPIFEHVHTNYGSFYSLVYCLFIFVITIGLFNVISAIFVESTMNSAAQLATGKKKARLQDETLWCTRVSTLVKRLMVIHANKDPDVRLTDNLEEVYSLDVPCCDIDDLARDPEAIAALNALDIVPEDRDYLSDILDPDNGGTINVIELVEGLRRLRGDPRRSDIVTVNLMIRSLQRNVADIFDALNKITPQSPQCTPANIRNGTCQPSAPTMSPRDSVVDSLPESAK